MYCSICLYEMPYAALSRALRDDSAAADSSEELAPSRQRDCRRSHRPTVAQPVHSQIYRHVQRSTRLTIGRARPAQRILVGARRSGAESATPTAFLKLDEYETMQLGVKV